MAGICTLSLRYVTANNLGPSDEITLKKTEKYCCVRAAKRFQYNFCAPDEPNYKYCEPFSNKRGISCDCKCQVLYDILRNVRCIAFARLCVFCGSACVRIALHDKACIILTRRKTNCLPMHYRSRGFASAPVKMINCSRAALSLLDYFVPEARIFTRRVHP